MKPAPSFWQLWPILAFIVTDQAFSEQVLPREDDPRLIQYIYGLHGVALLLILRYYRSLPTLLRGWLLAVLVALAALSVESYAGWGSWMVYPHVFAKLMVLLPTLALASYYCRHGLPPLGLFMLLVGLGLGVNLVFFHPDSLSMSAFLHNERGFNVTSAMLVLLPTLYYLNQYLVWGGVLRLLTFLGGVGMIVFLQHRSVWMSTCLALLLNAVVLFMGRIKGARLNGSRLLLMALIPLMLFISGGLAVLSDQQVRRRLDKSLQDIMHVDKQGTGSWRLKQFEAYEPFLHEYPVAGMRLKGFELPVQFYVPGTHEQVWTDGSGHHFHSFYVDRLFYFGLSGVLLLLLVPVGMLGWRLLQPVPLPPAAVAVMVFSLSTLLYGASYDWPIYFFGLLGLSLAAASLPTPAAWPAALPAPAQPVVSPASGIAIRYVHASARPARVAPNDARAPHRF
ncbi:MAG: hypothetical protein NVSMB30_09720 [Hymenobacter sp.]